MINLYDIILPISVLYEIILKMALKIRKLIIIFINNIFIQSYIFLKSSLLFDIIILLLINFINLSQRTRLLHNRLCIFIRARRRLNNWSRVRICNLAGLSQLLLTNQHSFLMLLYHDLGLQLLNFLFLLLDGVTYWF